MTKSKWLTVRLSETENRKLARSAASARMSKSSYVRRLISGDVVNITQLNVDGERLDALLYALKRSSSNLNQLAHHSNCGHYACSEEISEAINAHRDAALALSSLIDETRGRR